MARQLQAFIAASKPDLGNSNYTLTIKAEDKREYDPGDYFRIFPWLLMPPIMVVLVLPTRAVSEDDANG